MDISRSGAREPTMGRSHDQAGSDSEEVEAPQQQQQQQQPQFKRSLISPTQAKKGVLKRNSSVQSSSSASGSETGTGNPAAGRRLEPISSKRVIVDSLQSEIQVTRSDNSILRQDIQVNNKNHSPSPPFFPLVPHPLLHILDSNGAIMRTLIGRIQSRILSIRNIGWPP